MYDVTLFIFTSTERQFSSIRARIPRQISRVSRRNAAGEFGFKSEGRRSIFAAMAMAHKLQGKLSIKLFIIYYYRYKILRDKSKNLYSQGQFFSGNNQRIYLLGNPIIWWGNIVFLALFAIFYLYASVRDQRGCVDNADMLEHRSKITHAGKWIFLGWILHYAPFWAMSRVLYFHHYFPALLYSSMLTGITLNHIIESFLLLLPDKIGNTLYHVTLGSVISGTIYR